MGYYTDFSHSSLTPRRPIVLQTKIKCEMGMDEKRHPLFSVGFSDSAVPLLNGDLVKLILDLDMDDN